MSTLSEHARQRAGYYLNLAFDMKSTTLWDCIDILKVLIEIRNERVKERYNDLLTEYPDFGGEISRAVGHLIDQMPNGPRMIGPEIK